MLFDQEQASIPSTLPHAIQYLENVAVNSDGFNYVLAHQTRAALLKACDLIEKASITVSPEDLNRLVSNVVSELMKGLV